jgi:biotin carboxyl carrier protein
VQVKHTYRYLDNTFSFELNPTVNNLSAQFGTQVVDVSLISTEAGQIDLLIDGKPVRAVISRDKEKRWVTVNSQTLLLTKSSGARKNSQSGGHPAGQLVTPLPGQVRAVQITEGQLVTKGQTLLIVEAMKMEMKIVAPFDGVIKTLSVQVGQTVERDQVLGFVIESVNPASH